MLWRVRQEKDGFAGSEPGNVSCIWCHLSCTWLQGILGKPGTAWRQLEVPSDMSCFLLIPCVITFKEICPKMSDSIQPSPWAFTMPHLQRPSTLDFWSPPCWFRKYSCCLLHFSETLSHYLSSDSSCPQDYTLVHPPLRPGKLSSWVNSYGFLTYLTNSFHKYLL